MSVTKTVLINITGSNRGFGLAFTRHYVDSGWKVIAAARDAEGVMINLADTCIIHSLWVAFMDDKIVTLALRPGYVVTRMTGHEGTVTTEESVTGLANARFQDRGEYFRLCVEQEQRE
ncbi:hypothetical protein GN244_ATG16126 [Phytophthora infestans]|uniref:Short chain dehydrogenase n=1 Tax=Phytophthora infestans TaxID=4787 RepID=A0A833SDU2_PHYIN|nr:hypothetical protein GN244_ATG16126 [Phytophthora infestans]KAF4131745.1 hypothetical protein GN958_ATG19066 [Phytophthora infestans]KAF4146309.1 hypothetical protein GN958_ATG04495 [Phytophthora infestans]